MVPSHIAKQDKQEKEKDNCQKMFLLNLYFFVIINTSKTSHESKMHDIFGICVINFNETLVFKKLYAYLRSPLNEQVMKFLS